MLNGGWADPYAIRYVLTEQRSKNRVAKERGVTNSAYPLLVIHHGNHLCTGVCKRYSK